MTRYILTSIRTGNEIDVTYDDQGRLWAVALVGSYTDAEHAAVWPLMPTSVDKMKALVVKGVSIREVPIDLSFKTFYDKYKRKVEPDRAEKEWNKLKDADRMDAIAGIEKYDRWLAVQGTAKPYPDQYLKRRIWTWEDLKKPIAVSR